MARKRFQLPKGIIKLKRTYAMLETRMHKSKGTMYSDSIGVINYKGMIELDIRDVLRLFTKDMLIMLKKIGNDIKAEYRKKFYEAPLEHLHIARARNNTTQGLANSLVVATEEKSVYVYTNERNFKAIEYGFDDVPTLARTKEWMGEKGIWDELEIGRRENIREPKRYMDKVAGRFRDAIDRNNPHFGMYYLHRAYREIIEDKERIRSLGFEETSWAED